MGKMGTVLFFLAKARRFNKKGNVILSTFIEMLTDPYLILI